MYLESGLDVRGVHPSSTSPETPFGFPCLAKSVHHLRSRDETTWSSVECLWKFRMNFSLLWFFSTCKNGMLWPLKSRNISSKCVEQLSELWKTSRFTFAARYFTASFQNGKLLRRKIFSREFKTNIV